MKRQPMLMMIGLITGIWLGTAWSAGGYRLGPDDVVRISVYGLPDLSTESRISENGTIRFPLVGEIRLEGLTARQAETQLARVLKQKNIVKSPQVSLIVQNYQSQMVTVLGHVTKPGVYPITRGTSLMDLISQAGGLKEDAREVAILTRDAPPAGEKRTVDLAALLEGRLQTPGPMVRNGDRIYVPKADQFYVYGQVNRPGVYTLEPDMTVMQALSVAGGLTDKGTERHMQVRRKSPDGLIKTIPASLTLGLQPSDVLYVKESLF